MPDARATEVADSARNGCPSDRGGLPKVSLYNAWRAGRAPPWRPALVGNVGEERRLVIRKFALVVMMPNRLDDIVDLVERKRAVDEIV